MERKAKKPDLTAQIVARMHDPIQLRFALCAAVLAAWYFAAYEPMTRHIAETSARLATDRKRLALAVEVDALRTEALRFEDRLPPRSDPNEFFQFVLAHIRSGPLNLLSLNPEKPKDAGPFQIASVQASLEGKYTDIVSFLRWVETDRRMLRIDNIKVDPDPKDPELVKVQLAVVGLMGAEEPTAKGKGKGKPGGRPGAAPKPAPGAARTGQGR